MLDDVTSTDFQALRDGVPDLRKISDPIEEFDADLCPFVSPGLHAAQ
jgi:hypothetical protein